MSFKSGPVLLGISDTTIFECPVTFSGAIVLGIANVGSTARAYVIKFYKASTGTTTTIASGVSVAANTVSKFAVPISLESGDKISGSCSASATDVVVTPTVTLGPSSAAKGLTPRGEYAAGTTYAKNDLVSVSGVGSFISIVDSNIGNAPASSPSAWMVNAPKGDTGDAGASGTGAFTIVRVVSTTATDPTTDYIDGATIDGVTLATNDLLLRASTSNPELNGVYVVVASGAASRATALATFDSLCGVYFSAMEGTANADTLWKCTADKGGTLGTDPLTIVDLGAVRYDKAQTLSDAQKAQVRSNVGIPSTFAQVRLTLTQGVPVTGADVAGATTLYLEPFNGKYLSLWDGSRWVIAEVPATTISKDNTGLAANTNWDVFVYLSNEMPAIELQAWITQTARDIAITQKDGVDVKSGDPTRRLLGTIRTDASSTFNDTQALRHLSNRYNLAPRTMKVFESTFSWNYSTLAFRQMNGSTANQLDFVCCSAGLSVAAEAHMLATNSTTNSRGVSVGIGLDSTSINSIDTLTGRIATTTTPMSGWARYRGIPGIGRHTLVPLEAGNGNDVQTWYGLDSATVLFQTGITGEILG